MPDARAARRTHRGRTMRYELNYDALLLDLDGVLTSTTALHVRCWKQVFDDVLACWTRASGKTQEPFDERDYLIHVRGKPHADGVRDFLRSRGIDVPEGNTDSPATEWSVHGIGNRKQLLVKRSFDCDRAAIRRPRRIDFGVWTR